MNSAADPLAQLRDIQLPPDPGWWPLAPGWWLLAGGMLVLLIGLAWWWRRRQTRRAAGRAAILELDIIGRLDAALLPAALQQLLRRAARHRYGAEKASLGPAAFAAFLRHQAPPELADGPWQELATAAYRPTTPQGSGALLAHARQWLRHNLPC